MDRFGETLRQVNESSPLMEVPPSLDFCSIILTALIYFSFFSCCVAVQNIQRQIYFLMREKVDELLLYFTMFY